MDILVRSEQLLPMRYMSNLPRRAKQQSSLNSKLQEVLTELDSAPLSLGAHGRRSEVGLLPVRKYISGLVAAPCLRPQLPLCHQTGLGYKVP